MKNNHLLLFLLVFIPLLSFTQEPAESGSRPDTADFPYWVGMMQDPTVNFFDVVNAFDRYWEHRPVTRSSGWKVFKRWEYMMQSRIFPDGTRPDPAATTKAYASFLDQTESASGEWISLGPAEIPSPGPPGYLGLGRLNVIAFHPTDPLTLYVGAPSGGFWKSINGGLNWITTTDTLPTLGVSAIAVDITNASYILIGTGDRDAGDAPGLGVYASTDGGLTWSPSNSGMGNKTVGKIIQHPSTPAIFLAATSGGVYRSTNSGASWSLSVSGNFKDICFKPNDPAIVYATKVADFFRSSNNGVSFTQITNGLTAGQRGAIAVTPANPDYVYFLQSNNSSGFKGLYRSADAGLSFSTRSTTPNILDWSCTGSGTGGQGWYDLAIAADPLNAEIIHVGGINVWKSTNGGSAWAINSHWYGGCSVAEVHADCHYLTYSPVNGALWACNDGGVYFTTNGGTTWSDRTVTMTIGQIYKLGQSQTTKEKVINGFQDNGTYTYTATEWIQTGGGDGMECAIDYTNAAFTYHTLYYGDIYRQQNFSNELHIAGNGTFGITESGAWVTPFLLSVSDPKMMFVGYKNVWRCNDVRTTNNPVWVKLSNNLGGSNTNNITVLAQSPADSAVLYVAKYGNMLFRTDNCMITSPTWVNLTANLPATGTPTDLEAHPTDPNTLFMTLGNAIYTSSNKGQSWTNISGNLPSIHLNTVACYHRRPEALYVGTDAGVYYQDTTNSPWILFNAGLPVSAEITELEIYYDNDSVSADAIRASTYGRGLWSSDLYGVYEADFSADSTTICFSGSADFSDLSSGYPTAWTWSFPGGTPASSSLQNPQNILYSTPGTYDVTLSANWNGFIVSITKPGYITVNPSPSAPGKPAGDTALCINSPATTYTTNSVPFATAYTWVLNPDTAGVLTPADTTVSINWADTWTGYAGLTVQATGTCGSSPFSPSLQVFVSPEAGQPLTPFGPTPLCEGSPNTSYTTSVAPNAISYIWGLTPAGAGTIDGTGTTGTVTWDALFSGIADVQVKSVNGCGESSWSDPWVVTVNPYPLVNLGNDTTITWLDTLVLDAGNPGAVFLWSTGDTTQTIKAFYTGTPTTNFWAHVTVNSCTGNGERLITFVDPVTITEPAMFSGFYIIPNPHPGTFLLEIHSPVNATAPVRITGLTGASLWEQEIQVAKGITREVIQLPAAVSGVCFVQVTLNGEVKVKKSVVIR